MNLLNIQNNYSQLELTLKKLKSEITRANLEPNSEYRKRQIMKHCCELKRKIYKIIQSL